MLMFVLYVMNDYAVQLLLLFLHVFLPDFIMSYRVCVYVLLLYRNFLLTIECSSSLAVLYGTSVLDIVTCRVVRVTK
jgi:hypothetical protein